MDESKAKQNGKQSSESPERKAEQKKSRGKKVFSRLTKIVAGFVVVSLTATEAMMFILFGRTTPASNAPFPIARWAERNNYAWRSFDFMSGRNRLKGYVVSGINPKALIVLVHGIKSSSDELEPLVRRFVQEGYAVLTFDGTACGRSEGERTVGLQQQSYDLRAVLDYIREQGIYQGLPLVLFGHSAGAYGVAVQTGQVHPCAAICVSGFESPLNTMRFWADHYAGALTQIEYPFLWFREHAAKGRDANLSGSQAILKSNVPTLVVHGVKDDVVQMEISLYDALRGCGNSNVRCILVEDLRHSGHSDILISDGEVNPSLFDEISRFLESNIS